MESSASPPPLLSAGPLRLRLTSAPGCFVERPSWVGSDGVLYVCALGGGGCGAVQLWQRRVWGRHCHVPMGPEVDTHSRAHTRTHARTIPHTLACRVSRVAWHCRTRAAVIEIPEPLIKQLSATLTQFSHDDTVSVVCLLAMAKLCSNQLNALVVVTNCVPAIVSHLATLSKVRSVQLCARRLSPVASAAVAASGGTARDRPSGSCGLHNMWAGFVPPTCVCVRQPERRAQLGDENAADAVVSLLLALSGQPQVCAGSTPAFPAPRRTGP